MYSSPKMIHTKTNAGDFYTLYAVQNIGEFLDSIYKM